MRQFSPIPSPSMNPPKQIQPPAPSKPPELLSPRTFFIASFSLAALVIAVYYPALNFQFILDDHNFTNDPRLQSSGHVWEYFSNWVWAQFRGGPISFYRPLFILWLRLNFILSGLSPWGWHLLSVIKHLAVALLLGLLTWKLLKDRVAALLAATLFALHPAQTESVAWLTVPDPLMSLGILGALLLYLKYAESSAPRIPTQTKKSEKKSRKEARNEKSSQPPLLWLILSAVVCFAALLAKETAIILPPIIFALALLIPSGNPAPLTPESNAAASFASRLAQALRQVLPFACAALLYLILRFYAMGGKLTSATQQLPLNTVLLSWPATLWFYVRVLLWPIRSHSFADPTLVENFSARAVLLPASAVACVVAILAAAAFWASGKSQRDNPPQEARGIQYAVLIGALLLVSPILLALNLNALNPGDFLHGRYAYLSSAGLMLLLATAWHLSGKLRVPLLYAASLLAIAFAFLTVSQEMQWKDDLTVFTVAHQLAPHNAPVALHLADARVQAAFLLDAQGRCQEALPIFEQVSKDYPQEWYAWAGLGECYVHLNDLPKAEAAFHRAADLSHEPRTIQLWQELRAHMGLPASVQP
jgi:protein O-mannosyl-transferase